MQVVLASRVPRAARERQCAATGVFLPQSMLLRFVTAPDGTVIPDIAATLPGDGIWTVASRLAIEESVRRNLFATDLPQEASALAAHTEKLLARRILADLGLARRSGELVLGFDAISRAFRSSSPPRVLVEARDGAAEGRRKLVGLAHAAKVVLRIVDCLDSKEMSLALGRENVVHAALKSGRLSERLVTDAGRLMGLRSTGENSAGSSPAADESGK